MDAVVIATTPERSHWLKNCHHSLMGINYPVIILSDYTFELGKIRFIYEHTKIDQFLLLHDSCEIKDPSFIRNCFEYPHSVCLCSKPMYFGGYLGKYQRKVLDKVTIPVITSKLEAVQQEIKFNAHYLSHDMDTKLLFTDFDDNDIFVEKFGNKVMKIENKFLIKYKSYWNLTMVDGYHG